MHVFPGILYPFFGTALGAAAVLVQRDRQSHRLRDGLLAFAAGIMLAASIWSLLLPAIAQAAALGAFRFIPALLGLWFGVLLLCPKRRVRVSAGAQQNTRRMILAVVLHNIPEGMAVGVAYAALQSPAAGISEAAAFALSLGIAIQNLPEGAIISLPLHAEGMGKGRAFLLGVLSGAVEPAAALLVFLAANLATALLPVFLGFGAGAMLYVVLHELLPALRCGEAPAGTLQILLGFSLMLALDCAFS